jgi:glutaredoxin
MIKYIHNYLKYSLWCKEEYDEILENGINNNDVFIVGLTWCPWTKRSKELLKKEYNINPVIIAPDAISNEYKVEMLYCLCKRTNTVYVPQIWIKGKHIGNFEHLYKMHHRNQIKSSLEL